MATQYRKSARGARKAAPKGARPRKRAPSKKSSKKPAATPRRGRRIEILGVLVMAVALLWSLAVISYNPADNGEIAEKSFLQLFSQEHGTRVTNSLGPVGAYLARISVPNFFGLTSLLLHGLMMSWGYLIMRRKPLIRLWYPSLLGLIVMVYVAILLGRIGLDVAAWDAAIWAGGWGSAAGGWMHSVLGPVGSYGVLALILVVGLMLVIDRDIQRTLDRLETGLRRMRGAFKMPQWGERKPAPATTTWESLDEKEATPEEVEVSAATPEPAPEPADRPAEPRPHEIAEPAAPTGTAESEAEQEPEAPDIELKVYGQVEEEKATVVSRDAEMAGDAPPYEYPSISLLDGADGDGHQIDFDELEDNKRTLLNKLAVYNIEITDINAVVGPTVTLYELSPAPGVKISRIKSLENDVAMAMAAQGIRMIAPIPGKSVVGVEIPNRNRELVRVEQIIGTAKFAEATMELPVALGKTIEGEVYLQDLTKMPHLLIAGATGSGKSVGLNALIAGLLYACHPTNLKFVMIDPKKIELQQYRDLRDHFLAIPEDGDEAIITEVVDALSILKSCELEMEARYNLLSDARVRSIRDYNLAVRDGTLGQGADHKHLPYIVVIVDELADLMMTAGKDIEAPIARLAQMARAVGIHLVLATQRPSVDVITGLIKANFPSRVAFQVASKIDARTILDQNGAEQLVGNGDMLYMSGSRLLRLQGPFVSVQEIDRLMAFIQGQDGPGPYRLPAVQEVPDKPQQPHGGAGNGSDSGDVLFEDAARIIVRAQQGSVSLLQRKLSIGYTRAARIVDELERIGVVGGFQGAKAREVLVPDEHALESVLQSAE